MASKGGSFLECVRTVITSGTIVDSYPALLLQNTTFSGKGTGRVVKQCLTVNSVATVNVVRCDSGETVGDTVEKLSPAFHCQ